jgi:hypothetical protein
MPHRQDNVHTPFYCQIDKPHDHPKVSDDNDEAALLSSDDGGFGEPDPTPPPSEHDDDAPPSDDVGHVGLPPDGGGDDHGDIGDGDHGEPAADAPVLVAPPPPAPAGLGRAARAERWPPGSASTPWSLARISNKGVNSGWGATCTLHFCDAEMEQDLKRVCKKQLPYGGLDDQECRLRVMAWLVEGLDIDVGAQYGRTDHLAVKPRLIVLPDEQVLVDRALLRFP